MRVLVAAILSSREPLSSGGSARSAQGADAERAWYGDAITPSVTGASDALRAFLGTAAAAGLETLPLGIVAASAEGISRETLDTLRTRIFSELRGWKVDAVYLALPGATPIRDAASPTEDGQSLFAEVELPRAMRERLAGAVPIAVTTETELPPGVAQALAGVAECLTPQTAAGSDGAVRGASAARRLRDLLGDEVRAPGDPAAVWEWQESAAGPAYRAGGPSGGPSVQLVFPADTAAAVAPGEVVPLGLAVAGLAGRRVSAGWFVCDEMGEVRWDAREQRQVAGDVDTLRFAWPVQRADPPGVYSVRAMVWSPDDRWQGIASGTVEVVDPLSGRRAGGERFPALSRDRLLGPAAEHPPTPPATLAALFREAEPAVRAARHPDGSWGTESRDRRGPQHIAIYTRTAETATAYLQAYRLFGDAAYAAEARRGLDFLLDAQLPNGGWCPWSFTWVTPQWVFLREACFYDTGGVARALLDGYATLGDERYRQAVRRAGEYALTAPYTGNNNYDAFILWYLAPYAHLAGETRLLDHAVRRCREAVLPGQQPYGGFPAHNLSAGYQAIIAFGLLALQGALPGDHPYAGALRRATTLALNFLLWLQDEHGHFYSGWEYDRTFGVSEAGRPRGSVTSPANGRLVEVFRMASEQFRLEPGVYHSLCRSVVNRGTRPGQPADLLALTSLLTWSRGEPVSESPQTAL